MDDQPIFVIKGKRHNVIQARQQLKCKIDEVNSEIVRPQETLSFHVDISTQQRAADLAPNADIYMKQYNLA